MHRSTLLSERHIDRMYVPRQKVSVRIRGIKEDQEKRRGVLELEPTQNKWINFLTRYHRGSIVSGTVKIIDTSTGRVYVLLHTRRNYLVLTCKWYPLNRLRNYQRCYWGELSQSYQQEIQRRLGLL